MKRYIHVIIYVVLFLACFIIGQFNLLGSNENNSENESEQVSKEQKPSNIVIKESVELKIGEESFEHIDLSVSLATLADVVFEDEEIENPYDNIQSFIFISEDDDNLEILFKDLGVMSVEIEKDAIDEEKPGITLTFKTGGKIILQEGQTVKLYQEANGKLTIDERKHINFEYKIVEGKIKDIKFRQISSVEDDLYVEYMLLEDTENEEIIFEFIHMDLDNLKSEGEIIAEYVETVNGVEMYQPTAGESFKLKAIFDDNSYVVYEIGDSLEVVENYNGLYWELAQEIEITKYRAEVKDFIFGHDGNTVTSLDYIVFSIPEHDDVKMTFAETKANYAKPVGNYVKVYNHFHGKEQVLVDVQADENWMLKLDYNADDALELTYGTKVNIYEDNQGVWRIDRTKEEVNEE